MSTEATERLRTGEPNSEYRALTEACGLLDRSERGKLGLTGEGAVEFLNGQVTNELADLRPGEGRYAAFLTHKGKMLGDLRILAVGDDPSGAPTELLLDTERAALQGLFDMIRNFKVGYQVDLQKRTVQCALLSLVGPDARAVAARALGVAAPGASPGEAAGSLTGPVGWSQAEHAHVSARIGEHPVRLVSTAQPAGVDVFCDAGDRDAVVAALARAGALPVGEACWETVRVEHGRPRYGTDLDDTVIPQEAGLNERAVSFTKGCYVGQETVARLHYRGKPNRHLRGLRLSGPAARGEELRLAERSVGRVGSAVLSPALGPIALALVRREAEPGALVRVGEGGITARVTELPFAPAGLPV